MKSIIALTIFFALTSAIFASDIVKSGEILYFSGDKLLLGSGEIVNLKKNYILRLNNNITTKFEIKSGQIAYAKLNPETLEAVSVDIYDSSVKNKTKLENLYINEFTILNKKPLKKNEYLNIVLKGAPKKLARLNILGLMPGIKLKETSAGEYKASFKILTGYDISNATLIAELADKDKKVSAVYSGISFAATAPIINETSPQNQSISKIDNPNIFISYKSPGTLIDVSRCAMIVNGVPVSCFKNTSMMFYKPESLPHGKNTVKAVITDLAGNVTYYSWSFYLC